jgi:DNA-binding GntR family transcriptional regulator
VTTPDYQRIIEDVKNKIAAGVLKPGDRLPSIRVMAGQYDTSQTTVKVALAILRAQGIVRGHQGKASYVAEPGGASPEA